MGRIRHRRLLLCCCVAGWGNKTKNGRGKPTGRNFRVFGKSPVLGSPFGLPSPSKQKREAPPPGSLAKLLTANGHFVRDSSPPRVTISRRVPALFSFIPLLSFDCLRHVPRNHPARYHFSRIVFQGLSDAYFAIFVDSRTDKQCRPRKLFCAMVLCVSIPFDRRPCRISAVASTPVNAWSEEMLLR